MTRETLVNPGRKRAVAGAAAAIPGPPATARAQPKGEAPISPYDTES